MIRSLVFSMALALQGCVTHNYLSKNDKSVVSYVDLLIFSNYDGTPLERVDQWLSSVAIKNKITSVEKEAIGNTYRLDFDSRPERFDYSQKLFSSYSAASEQFKKLCISLKAKPMRVSQGNDGDYFISSWKEPIPYDSYHQQACVVRSTPVLVMKFFIRKNGFTLQFEDEKQIGAIKAEYVAYKKTSEKERLAKQDSERINQQKLDALNRRKAALENAERVSDQLRFHKTLAVGDRSNLGDVVEIRRPMILVSDGQQHRWVRIEDIFPVE